ncbi:MAG: putative manganese transporter [Sarcina sp.]
MREMLNLLIKSASDAFLQVGVFVGVVLLIFTFLDYFNGGKITRYIEKSKRLQPIIGAFLGLTPGCGGAILVMPLFVKGTVSYGTVIATLIATMGDAAFVIMTTQPLVYAKVSIISFVIAMIVGYLVDYFKLEEKFGIRRSIDFNKDKRKAKKEIIILTKIRNKSDKLMEKVGVFIFWGILLIGLVLGVMLLMQIDLNQDLGINNFGLYFGAGGMLISFLYLFFSKSTECSCNEKENFRSSLVHSAKETAFVNLWVMVAYLIYEVGIHLIGGEDVLTTLLMASGLAAVLIGALIGIIPGCGPQIIFVTLYGKGLFPFAALLANVISQDGDALLPLMAKDKKSSLIASIITTIPALFVGIVAYYI